MNELIPFDFAGRGARGVILRIESGVDEMFGARDYPPEVRGLLGQAAAAAPLLATHLKFEGRINLQFQGGEQIQLLVAQVDHHLQTRAMAKCADGATGRFAELLKGGVLAWLLEPRSGEPYQAWVDIAGDSLAATLEAYFRQSEQLPTRVLLAAGRERLAGIMLQRMPGDDDEATEVYWSHLGSLFDTLGEEELLQTDSETVLRRLFHQEPLRAFEPRPVSLSCTCARASISGMLLSLGREEVDAVLETREQVEVTCEFCGREYRYSRSDVSELFSGAEAGPEPGAPRH